MVCDLVAASQGLVREIFWRRYINSKVCWALYGSLASLSSLIDVGNAISYGIAIVGIFVPSV